ncbi:ABC transporter ATP-binding protein [Extibacter muris]|uniref:ABC transporter ATP-binding protein n=1 Tax=Extibacter muris TaxID=1796622 RepID=UPI001D05C446|nr:ABC transporter ATP-binding protein [Extibacter muris]MCB6203117.1 ABC transporter ATP-binding protein [Extibacter muris]MCQ4664342.1 ABC transporter ATP-binding protein [Extibacter muris]MCQ4692320.1 ABC transporter ATP-binding protein [Extibacter muris]MCQ4692435.1 ABC transporter ATP-binding protein [Extibacter muris]
MSNIIRVRGLTKSYGNHVVLKGLDFSVNEGEIFALLGVNGAGKTTALECMEGLKKYDGGEITVTGKMGIQLQSASLPEHIKSMEAVQLFAKWNKTAVDKPMLETLGIMELAKKQYHELSTGQKRRLHLALALIGGPEILFLDEPTAGLDVEGRVSLHEQIRRLKSQGKTIVLASHDMAEVENLCDRIAILNDGKIAFSGTVGELTSKVGKQYDISIRTGQGTQKFEAEDIGEALLSLLQGYKEKGTVILDIQVNRGSLEQHFMKIARGE